MRIKKRVIASILAVTMLFSLAVTAIAEGETEDVSNRTEITVDGTEAVDGTPETEAADEGSSDEELIDDVSSDETPSDVPADTPSDGAVNDDPVSDNAVSDDAANNDAANDDLTDNEAANDDQTNKPTTSEPSAESPELGAPDVGETPADENVSADEDIPADDVPADDSVPLSVFEQLMATTTIEEFNDALMETVSDPSVFSAEDVSALFAHLDALPCEDEDLYEKTQNILLILQGMVNDICTVCGGISESHYAHCPHYEWMPFSVDTKNKNAEKNEIKFFKQLVTDDAGNTAIEIDVWEEGTVEVIPTDVVLVIDQSASMLNTVDNVSWTYDQFLKNAKTEKGAYEGYYMVTALNKGNENGNKTGNDNAGFVYSESGYDYCLAMVRYNKEQQYWERSTQIKSLKDDYDGLGIYLAFDEEELNWYPIEQQSADKDGHNTAFTDEGAKYYTSIYGATLDGLYAFLKEASGIRDCRIAISTFATGSDRTYGWGGDIYSNSTGTAKYCNWGGTGFFQNGQYINRKDANDNYGNAFVSMNSAQGQITLKSMVANLKPFYSNTTTHEGLAIAEKILAADSNTNSATNTFIIVFTDGLASSVYEADFTENELKSFGDNDQKGQNAAIYVSKKLKDKTNHSVFTIGRSFGDHTFLEYMSSNYPDATTLTDPGDLQRNDCHFMANDATELENAFGNLGVLIFNSSQVIDNNTQVRDTITTYFEIGGGYNDGNITVHQISCSGVDAAGNATFDDSTAVTLYDLTDEIEEKVTLTKNENVTYDQVLTNGNTEKRTGTQIVVTGYDYIANSVFPTEAKGAKLRILIPIVPNGAFVGGNQVDTNSADSGIYNENGDMIQSFPVPDIDVTLLPEDITINPRYAYIGAAVLQNVTVPSLNQLVTVWVGESALVLNLGKENWGLTWQLDYAKIDVVLLDEFDNPQNDGFKNITEDTTFKVRVTITPKLSGSEPLSTDSDTGIIHVFYPELNFKDKLYWYGETLPGSADLQDALVKIRWKNKDGRYTDQTAGIGTTIKLLGEMPDIKFTCTPQTSFNIVPKSDTPVQVDVTDIGYFHAAEETNLNQYCSFAWQACMPACGLHVAPHVGTDSSYEFYIHPQTCQLTITKDGGEAGEPYVFTVLKDGQPYTEVSITYGVTEENSVTIYELPVGNYTVEENEDWSWRYKKVSDASDTVQIAPSYSPENGVSLTSDKASGVITCTNNKNQNLWLNGFSTVVKNVFNKNEGGA